jgi:hypothetical protein
MWMNFKWGDEDGSWKLPLQPILTQLGIMDVFDGVGIGV